MTSLNFYCGQGGGWDVVRVPPHGPDLHGLKLPLRATRGSMQAFLPVCPGNAQKREWEIGLEAC